MLLSQPITLFICHKGLKTISTPLKEEEKQPLEMSVTWVDNEVQELLAHTNNGINGYVTGTLYDCYCHVMLLLLLKMHSLMCMSD